MDIVQKKFERAVGDRFVEWLNAETGSEYCFTGRPDRAPDLRYSSNGVELLIEVTAGYYDPKHAAFIWKGVRGAKDAPVSWSGVNPNKSLAAAIFNRVEEKAKKRYGDNTVLLIEIQPGVTSVEELAALLRAQKVQFETPFTGIYVG